MAKKDFSNINTGRVYDAIADATADPAQEAQEAQQAQEVKETRKTRRTYNEQEAQEFTLAYRTSGRKGLKIPRINMGFTPDIYEYIQTMSRVSGISMTDFVNLALRQHRDDHKEIYEKAIEFRNSL